MVRAHIGIMDALMLALPPTLSKLDQLITEAWAQRDTDPKKVRQMVFEARQLSETTGYQLGLGRSLTISCFLHSRTGSIATGLEEALEALEILELFQDLDWLPKIYNILGIYYDLLGDRPRAMSWLLKQLELAQLLGEVEQEAAANHDLGYVARELEQKRDYYYKAYHLFKGMNNGFGVVLTCLNLADDYTKEGNFDKALQLTEEAMSIKDHQGEAISKPFIQVSLGTIYAAQGLYDQALKHFLMALELKHQTIGNTSGDPRIYLEIGHLYQQQEHFEKAEYYYREALSFASNMDSKMLVYSAHEKFANLYKTMGQFEKAFFHFETFHKLKEAHFNQESEEKTRAMEVLHRTETAKKEAALQQRKNLELQASIERLKRQNSQVKALSNTDPLTGLFNRRYLSEYLGGLEPSQVLTLVILDIDYFKKINDSYSHLVGDEVLRNLGKLLTAFLRTTDFAARFGGEEFVIVLNNATLEQSTKVCERLRQRLTGHTWSETHPDLKITLSMGLASGAARDYETLLQEADKKLYQAKHQGRDRFVA